MDKKSYETPMLPNAFKMDDQKKIEMIAGHFREIMRILGLDTECDSIKSTPYRVAKMYVKEIFSGLDPKNKPTISLFENKFSYDKMIVERDITVQSNCEHHFVPFLGKAHVGYFANGKVIGLSKINRIVQYYSRRPQLQERLTMQIAHEIMDLTNAESVAVLVKAKHMCVASRGIQDDSTSTITAEYSGKFNEPAIRDEFLKYVGII
jgi:GTP cyclohydrolase IA